MPPSKKLSGKTNLEVHFGIIVFHDIRLYISNDANRADRIQWGLSNYSEGLIYKHSLGRGFYKLKPSDASETFYSTGVVSKNFEASSFPNDVMKPKIENLHVF